MVKVEGGFEEVLDDECALVWAYLACFFEFSERREKREKRG